VLRRSSRLSRLAEQLGWAIRQSVPSAVEPERLGGRSRRRRPTERRSSCPKTRSGFAGSAVPNPNRQPVLCAGGEASSARNRGVSLLGGRRSIAARRRFLGGVWRVAVRKIN